MRLLFDKAERGGKDVLQLTHLLTSMAAAGSDSSEPYGRYQPVSALLIRQAMNPYVPHWMKVRCTQLSFMHAIFTISLPALVAATLRVAGGLLPNGSAGSSVTRSVCAEAPENVRGLSGPSGPGRYRVCDLPGAREAGAPQAAA